MYVRYIFYILYLVERNLSWLIFYMTLTQRRDLSIPFTDKEKAEIAMNSLNVDPEPRRTKVTKTLKVQENILVV